MKNEIGKEKWEHPKPAEDEIKAHQATIDSVGEKIKNILYDENAKQTRNEQISEIKKDVLEKLSEDFEPSYIKAALNSIEKEEVRNAILNDSHRPDGRKLNEIRNLNSEIGYIPMVHGSGLFTRGETQILDVLTLASAGDAQKLDGFSPQENKFFIHHYNFPPYSAGETGRFGFTGRREIGHGALAERAL